MADTKDTAPEIELEHSLSDTEIDEILGTEAETPEEDGLWSFEKTEEDDDSVPVADTKEKPKKKPVRKFKGTVMEEENEFPNESVPYTNEELADASLYGDEATAPLSSEVPLVMPVVPEETAKVPEAMPVVPTEDHAFHSTGQLHTDSSMHNLQSEAFSHQELQQEIPVYSQDSQQVPDGVSYVPKQDGSAVVSQLWDQEQSVNPNWGESKDFYSSSFPGYDQPQLAYSLRALEKLQSSETVYDTPLQVEIKPGQDVHGYALVGQMRTENAVRSASDPDIFIVPTSGSSFDTRMEEKVSNFKIDNAPEYGSNFETTVSKEDVTVAVPVMDERSEEAPQKKEEFSAFSGDYTQETRTVSSRIDESMPAYTMGKSVVTSPTYAETDKEKHSENEPVGASYSNDSAGGVNAKNGDRTGFDSTQKDSNVDPHNASGGPTGGRAESHTLARNMDVNNVIHANRDAAVSKVSAFGEKITGVVQGGLSNVTSKMDPEASGKVAEVKNSYAVQAARIVLSTSGVSATASMINAQNKAINSVGATVEDAIGKKTITLEQLKDKSPAGVANLAQSLNDAGYRKSDIAKILYNKQGIADQIIANDYIKQAYYSSIRTNKELFSDKEKKILRDGDLFSKRALRNGTYSEMMQKAFRQNGSSLAGVNIAGLRTRDLKKYIKNSDKLGLSLGEVSLLKRELSHRLGKGASGFGRGLGKARSLASLSGRKMLESDENFNLVMGKGRQVGRIAGGVFKARKPLFKIVAFNARSTYKLARFTGRVINKIPVINKVTAPIAEGIGSVKSAVTNNVKAAREAKKTVSKSLKNSVYKVGGTAKAAIETTKPAQTIKQATQKIHNTKAYQFTKKAAHTTKKAAKTAGSVASNVGHAISLPFKAVGQLFDVLSMIKRKILVIAGIAIAVLALTWVVLMLLTSPIMVVDLPMEEGTRTLGEGIDAIRTTCEDARTMYEYTIDYNHYEDMQDDVDYLLELDEKTYEKAVEFGEGEPDGRFSTSGDGRPDNEVYDHHIIDRWGDEEVFPVGYTIHYVDAYGNELASEVTNAKDIEALCIAMIGNDMSAEYKYSNALKRFDDLLEDMHELMIYKDEETGLPFTYEASDIYYCSGCEEYTWECNDISAYDEASRKVGEKVYFEEYPLDPEYDEEAHHEEWVEDYYSEEGGHWECDHSHSTMICHGHRTVDITITLYDIEYAINENIWPETKWYDRYHKMIRDFVKKGAWENNYFAKLARNYFYGTEINGYNTGDWYLMYGVLIDGATFDVGGYTPGGGHGHGGVDPGPGGSLSDPLSSSEVNALINQLRGKGIDETRLAVIKDALAHIGKYSYSLTREGHLGGIYTNSGKSECSGFVSGVLNRVGVDYYGTQNKDNFSAAVFKGMSNGSMTTGSVISNGKHVMIYLGEMDGPEGRGQYTIECNSAFGHYSGGSMLTKSSDSRLSSYRAWNYW